jgi:hypothetical protein
MTKSDYEPLIQKSLSRLSKTVEQTQDAENGFKELTLRVKQEIGKIIFRKPKTDNHPENR